MKIIVCIKQVPDTNEVTINPETNTLNRAGVPSIVNPFDKFALEMALILKDRYGAEITVITMGPQQAAEALKECYAMGADRVLLISDRLFGGSDTLATSYTLAHTIKKIGDYDLIICGKQAIDGDTAQVGTGIAEWLDLPQVVCGTEVTVEGDKVIIKKELDVTYELIEMKIPALVTISKAFEPRNPNIRRRLQANKLEIPVWTAADLEEVNINKEQLGLKGSPTKVKRIFAPAPRGAGIKIGNQPAADAVNQLVAYLLDARGHIRKGSVMNKKEDSKNIWVYMEVAHHKVRKRQP